MRLKKKKEYELIIEAVESVSMNDAKCREVCPYGRALREMAKDYSIYDNENVLKAYNEYKKTSCSKIEKVVFALSAGFGLSIVMGALFYKTVFAIIPLSFALLLFPAMHANQKYVSRRYDEAVVCKHAFQRALIEDMMKNRDQYVKKQLEKDCKNNKY